LSLLLLLPRPPLWPQFRLLLLLLVLLRVRLQ
jgi:hypothetical protein